MTILITGGAGYIGSHCCIRFMEAGHDVVVLDNFSNSHPKSLERASKIIGQDIQFGKADIRDQDSVEAILKRHQCTAVIHFAGLKAVGESATNPLSYYDNNVTGTLRLLDAMKNSGVHDLIFSSSATVYGVPKELPLRENHSLNPVNPYGRTKLMVEDILRDLAASNPHWRFGILRYFNPVGAHSSGLIGEDPLGIPNNLMPFIAQVAAGRREKLSVFGKDYETQDGTGVRDYIHVLDLVEGHLRAYEALANLENTENCFVANLGTGTGYSVLEMVHAFERASNRKIAYEIAPRREGDVAECYANTELASHFLNWSAKQDLHQMCQDTWNWVCKNPDGYASS
ncbi:MAG: UDP-glucose 4-epimerase GalE [Roseibium sp.]